MKSAGQGRREDKPGSSLGGSGKVRGRAKPAEGGFSREGGGCRGQEEELQRPRLQQRPGEDWSTFKIKG